jgi:hypothetical protein
MAVLFLGFSDPVLAGVSGACCESDNTCTDAVSQITCEGGGGTYLDDNSVCQPDAGSDQNVCEGETVSLNGTGNSSCSWSTSGDGNFDDNTALNAVYTPGPADLFVGSVELVLFCSCEDLEDSLTVFLVAAPTADAGANQKINQGDTAIMAGATSNSTGCSWNTSGDGTFDDNTSLTAEYTPGLGDLASGNVELSLTCDGDALCDPAEDSMILTINLGVTGACCPVDVCVETTEEDCETNLGGVYFGDNTECADVNCTSCAGFCGTSAPSGCFCDNLCLFFNDCCFDACDECGHCIPTGACCESDDSCTDDVSEAACTGGGGDWAGDGVLCADITCPLPPTGACCESDDSCTDDVTLADCTAGGGDWAGDGVLCADITCPLPTGACCESDDSCTDDVTEAACTGGGGDWAGDGVLCADITCPLPPTGACCESDDSCTDDVTLADCSAGGGDWAGDGVLCADISCPLPTGACCAPDGTCTVTFEIECADVWTEGEDCDPNPCPQPPENDLCVNAISVDVGSSVLGTTINSTFDGVGTCGTSNTTGGVWYTVVGNGNTLTATTCNGVTDYDSKISVFCGTCDSRTCVTGNDDSCAGFSGLLSTVTWCSEPDRIYFVLVHGFSSQVGNFRLDILDGADCASPIDCGDLVGACCLPDDSCEILTEADCTTQSGGYAGDGVACDAVSCPLPPTGACCESDDSCTEDMSETNCNGGGGTWAGEGVLCADITCPLPTGACCESDDSCTDDVSEAACIGGGGTWAGDGVLCADITCPLPPTGACCESDDSCTDDVSETNCTTGGGTWAGEGVVCADVTCPLATGACCESDDSCTEDVSETNCTTGGGTWAGDGVLCADVTCPLPTGACCAPDGSCSVTTAAACAGDWTAGEDCDPNPCPQPAPTGACCETDGSCTNGVTEAACDAGDGTWQGDGVLCADVSCPPPGPQPIPGACCLPDGSCQDVASVDACVALGGTHQGEGSTCATSECPDDGRHFNRNLLRWILGLLFWVPPCAIGMTAVVPVTLLGLVGFKIHYRHRRYRRR